MNAMEAVRDWLISGRALGRRVFGYYVKYLIWTLSLFALAAVIALLI